MRVVWVTTQTPSVRRWAANAIEFEILRYAARRHDVALVSSGIAPDESLEEVERLGVHVHGVSWTPNAGARNNLVRAGRLLTRDAGATYFRDGDRAQAIARVLSRVEPSFAADVIHVQGEAAPALHDARAPSVLWLFDEHTRMIRSELEAASAITERLLWHIQLHKIRRWERRHYRDASSIACVSSRDADELAGVLDREVEAIPSPIPEDFFEASGCPRDELLATFVGSLGWRPNADAVLWLLSEIWPLVVRSTPGARLRIVGRDPGPEILAAAARSGVAVDADVADVRPAYWKTSVALAPIRLGAGLQTKVIHAMACGAPVVATPRALEGTGAQHRKHALVGTSAAELAAAIGEVLIDPASARDRARSAADLAGSFAIDVVGARIEDWWSKAVDRAKER